MKITGKTKVVGLFGYPVEHSLSPAMHNAAFDYMNLDYCYVAFSVSPEQLGDAIISIKALNLRGVNITVPHKENAIPFLDEVNAEASFIGAVNTIVNSDGTLTGYNTDGRGFMKSLSESGISVERKSVLIIGAGGACRAISYYLSERAANLRIFDIDNVRVGRLVSDLSKIHSNVGRIESLNDLGGIDIVINATPLGLKDKDPFPVNVSLITERMIVCDLIYRDTPLLKAASGKGCKTLNGLGMLLHQGALAFEIWTGIKPPVGIMLNAIVSAQR